MVRLVDYFVVAGYDGSKGVSLGGFTCRGRIIQRFPLEDWPDSPFTEGLELFCQPDGWTPISSKKEPSFFVSVLTDVEGRRRYCSVLTFYEAAPKKTNSESPEESSNVVLPGVPGITLPTLGSSSSTAFAPKCLVLISPHNLPDVFRNILGVVYTVYNECLVGHGGEKIRLETLVGTLLGSVYIPDLPSASQVRFSLGGTDKMSVQPPLYPDIPVTGTKVSLLFRQLGIQSVLTLFCAALTECKIVFYSRSFSRLTDSCMALISLLYPMKYSHVFIPILPSALIEVLSTPTPFIIGVNSRHKLELAELLDVIVVDLDGGAISVPENMKVQSIYEPLYSKIQMELSVVLHPELNLADDAFKKTVKNPPQPDSTLDKELRAVMLRLVVQILAGYRSSLTLVRIHPKPYITFHKAAFLGMRNQTDSAFMKKIVDCMFFNTFVSERGTPWRRCDVFDDLYCMLGDQSILESQDPSKTIRHIGGLAEELWRNENPVTSSNQPYAQKIPQPHEGALNRIHQPVFPVLDEAMVGSIIKGGVERHRLEEMSNVSSSSSSVPLTAAMKLVPMGQQIQEVTSPHSLLPNSARRLEVLRNCICSIFENKISDAKKIFPAVLSALKSKQARIALCDELDAFKSGNQVLLDHPQFDMIVTLMNSALQDDSDMDEYGIAATLLPLSLVFGRKLSKGVIQYSYTLIQDHAVWQNITFWEASFYGDVQKGIKSLYLSLDEKNTEESEHLPNYKMAEIRRSMVEEPTDKSVLELAASEIRRWDLLPSDTQKELISAEESTVYSQVFDYTNKMICLLCPLDGTYPSGGAAGRKKRFPDDYENQSYSISNSVAESESIDAESGFEDQEMSDVGQNVIRFVSRFADKVCAESHITEDHVRAVNQMIPGTVAMHLENLEAVSKQAKLLPPIQKPKIHEPSLLPGEELIFREGIRVYLLPTGRGKGDKDLSLLPAGGALFLTKYRVIFKGTPINPFAADRSVVQSFPVSSVLREKRFAVNEYLTEIKQQLKEGILIKSNTFQIIRAAFDDEVTVEQVENFRRSISLLQSPENIFHFFAFCSAYPSYSRKKEKSSHHQKYSTIRGLASKTLKNVSRAAGLKSSSKRKHSKFLIPSVVPAMHGRLSLQEITNGVTDEPGRLEINDSSCTLGDAVGGAPITDEHLLPSPVMHHPILNIPNNSKTLDRLSDRTYFKDWIRLGFIPVDYNVSIANKTQHSATLNHHRFETESSDFRVSSVNYRYGMCGSYPALLLIPSKISNDSVKRYARCHKQGRFPVLTWKHPDTNALLLRGAGFHGRGVMGMLRRHQEGTSGQSTPGVHVGSSGSSSGVVHTAELTSSLEAEQYFSAIIGSTPAARSTSWEGSDLSINSLALSSGRGGESYPDNPTLTPNASRKYNNPIAKAVDTLTRNTPAPKFNRLSVSSVMRKTGSQNSLAVSKSVDASLHRASLYIFGDKIKGVKVESHPKTEFIPIEFPDTRKIRASFKKLMRACLPSAPLEVTGDSENESFLKQVEDSEWLNGLQVLLQISGAVVDLIDLQGASVMLCLEDGWDITAQISSISQLCMDPYYRTIEGFKVLIEKEWLALGHRFNHRSNLSNTNQDSASFTPLFLQFLDIVHQIHSQFPMAFEFNKFYIKFLAYHHVSCRFKTFLCDCEAQRFEAGLLEDDRVFEVSPFHRSHPSSPTPPDGSSDEEIYSGSSRMNAPPTNLSETTNLGVGVFEYIDRHHCKSPIFYNFMYSGRDGGTLRPFSNVSNLHIWDYYMEKELKHGPSYDLELYELDKKMEEEFLDRSFHSSPREREDPLTVGYDPLPRTHLNVFSEYLNEIGKLQNEIGLLGHRWTSYLNQNSYNGSPVCSSSEARSGLVEMGVSSFVKLHGKTVHKRSTMELLLRGRAGSDRFNNGSHPSSGTNNNNTPHRFEKHHYSAPTSCDWCNSLLWGLVRTGHRCSDCGYNCHEKCKEFVPKNCRASPKFKSVVRDSTTGNFETLIASGNRDTSSGSGSRPVSETRFEDEKNSQIICQGYLHKQAHFRIKGWKQRWFVLDSTKHQLRYYDSRDDCSCKGYIDLSEIKTVLDSTTQPNASKKCVYFFELQTNKRTFYFGAESKTAAKEWISKIQSCLQ